MQEEIWKDVPGYEGLYQVSNYGNIKSLSRYRTSGKIKRLYAEMIVKIHCDTKGYPIVILSKNNIRKTFKRHRLVGMVFVDNKENKPQINHIDGIKKNNYFENLEWCSNSENQIHAFKNGLNKPKSPMSGKRGKLHGASKCIIQYSKDMVFIAEYWGALEAYRNTGIDHRSINSVCSMRKSRKTAGGFIWRFKNENIKTKHLS